MAKLAINYPMFRHAPAVTIGRGSLRSVARDDAGSTAYLVSGSPAVRQYLADALDRESVTLNGDNCCVKPAGEPTVGAIRAGAAFLAARKFQRIVAIGGGSVLDWARLAWGEAAGLLDLNSGKIVAQSVDVGRPVLYLVPTTCGTGAEAADVVVYAMATGEKRSIVSSLFAADQVILDGRFLDGMPAVRMAAFVSDALSHAIESYVSVVPTGLAKAAAVNGLEILLGNFSREPSHSQQDRLMEGSFLAGVAAANCSVGIVHAFAHSVGRDKVPHGIGNAAALDAGIEFNAATPQMADLLARLRMTGPDHLREQVEAVTGLALEVWRDFPALCDLGKADYRAEIADRMSRDVTIRSNPRRPSTDERLDFVATVGERLASR